jgi:O-antigen/teichoic acid export membrane protein
MSRDNETAKGLIQKFKLSLHSLRTKIISILSSDPLLKGILILGSGTAISQVLGVIFVPIITRIYPPGIYGTAAVFTSILQILTVVSTLRYEYAMFMAETEDDAEYLLILCLLILSTLTIIMFVVLLIWGEFLAGIFQFEFLAPNYWLLAVGFLGGSLYLILKVWNLLPKDYVLITKTGIIQSVTGSASKIVLGILSLGSSYGLIVGDIIGRTVGFGALGKKIIPKLWHSRHDRDIRKLKSLAYQYWKFPVFSMPSALINGIALQIPTLILAYMYDYQVVGLYALSLSITLVPVSFISGSIAQAYTAECSDLFRQRSDKILPLFIDTTKKLLLFGAPIIFVGAIISPFLFPIIFGSAWKGAGIFVIPISFFVVSQFVVTSTDRLELYGYNHWALIWNICRTLLVIVGFYVAILLKLSPFITIAIFSAIMTTMYAVCYFLNIKAIKLCLQK